MDHFRRCSMILLTLLLLDGAAMAAETTKLVHTWADDVHQYVTPSGKQYCIYAKPLADPSQSFGIRAPDDNGPLALIYMEKGADLDGALTIHNDDDPPIHSDKNVAKIPHAAVIAISEGDVAVNLTGQLLFAHTIRVATKLGLHSFSAEGVFQGFMIVQFCKSYIRGFHDGRLAR